MSETQEISAAEASATLGVSRDTLYAYVSRGLVRAAQDPEDARKSLYDRRDIDALLARKRRGRSRKEIAASTLNWGEPVLPSKITRIADGAFYYCGADAVALSRDASLEDIARRIARIPVAASAAVHDGPSPPRLATPLTRMMQAMSQAAIEPPGQDGPAEGGRLLRRIALSAAGTDDPGDLLIHDILARAWSKDPRAPDLLRRALVLCADHELNASAYATRVVASTGAWLPACLLTGLAALSGPRHGGIIDVGRSWVGKAARSVAQGKPPDLPEGDEPPPGFGHPLYPNGDPRALELLDHCPPPPEWTALIDYLGATYNLRPSLDIGLITLERQLKLPRGAGFGIFAVGRTAGWLAHIFEQRRSGHLIRPRAFYGAEN
ncbi:MAG: helix-turn-helix domain-containing protein [Alphaproteobacteria bacterium]|nr:helix-turn-helix domain-containing protein [Alphaproteobacteria bacterium]